MSDALILLSGKKKLIFILFTFPPCWALFNKTNIA